VDWVSQAKLVQARLNEPIEGADQRLDHMLRGWAAERPAMDEAALVAGVMSQIRVPRRRALYPMLRIGAPLAAAAVLVFSLSTFLWTRPQAAPTWLVDIHRPVSSSVTGSDVIVSFVREVEIVEEPVEASSIAFLTLGAVPAVPSGEAPL
jgi:hypothetical protein